LILRKIIKIVATRCQILRLKCTNTALPQTPYLDLRGSTSKRREGRRRKGGKGGEGRDEKKEREGKREGRGGEGGTGMGGKV